MGCVYSCQSLSKTGSMDDPDVDSCNFFTTAGYCRVEGRFGVAVPNCLCYRPFFETHLCVSFLEDSMHLPALGLCCLWSDTTKFGSVFWASEAC